MRYRTRPARLEQLRRPVERGPAIVVVFSDDWPAADQAAFDGGDPAVRDALVERHTGQRLGPRTHLLVVRRREDGPP
jgi:hypothetical protein